MRPWFVWFARHYLRWRASRQLDGVYAAGLDRTRALLAQGPVLFAANHVGWWDGPCMVLADEVLGAEGRFVVDAASLIRHPYFGWLGAIPLDRTSAPRMRPAFRAAAAALGGPHQAVWFFPQGRERPSWARPLGLGRGHEILARRAALVPVSVAYAFRGAPVPAAFLHFGAPVAAEGLETALIHGLDAIDRHLEAPSEAFETIVPSAARRPEEGLGARLLGGVSRA